MLDSMSDPDPGDPERAIASILDRLGALYEEAEATIDAITDPDEAFAYATDLANQTRMLHDEVEGRFRKLRGRQASRIRNAEALSLKGLADRISVSKSRAQQLVVDATGKSKGELP
jgi:hypothetical protein